MLKNAKNIVFYFLLFFGFLQYKGFATHIVGGEIYYDDLGGGNYKVTLKLYRDCSVNTNAAYDDPASIMVFDAAGTVHIEEMLFPGSINVPDSINNACFNAPTNICVQEAVYQKIIHLPPKTGGWYLVYQRCCRNNSILNLINPGSIGSTYYEHIPGPEVVAFNSSPRFNHRPKKYICNGFDVHFDHSATDPDGDSLVYSLAPAFTGLDACCPKLGTGAAPSAPIALCPSPPPSCPQTGLPPPYSSVPYVAPYSGAFPMSSNPSLSINPVTGMISGVPNVNGQWVVGVCVKEYRNGVLIGQHYRDFQYNVTACHWLYVSAIQNQTQFCFGLTVNFQNLSINGTSYQWNFGDLTTTNDVSTLTEPSYTYPDTGKYTVTLIVNPGNPCTDTSQQTFTVYPLLNPNFVPSYTNACVNNNSFSFTAGGYFAPYSTFNWNFGPNATPTASTQQNPSGVSFNGAGDFPVVLTVHEASCTGTFADTVHVYDVPVANFNTDSLIGCQPYTAVFSDSSLHGTPVTYLWTFGDGSTSTQANPQHTYINTGLYNVSLTIITTTGCIDTSTFFVPGMVTVKPSPDAGFIATPMVTDIFNSTISFIDTSKYGVSMTFNTQDGNTYDYVPAQHYYDNFGDFWVTQIVMGSNGCPDTARVLIKILPEYLIWVPNAFTPFDKDNLNDVFKPETFGVTEYTMYIFDRWGNLIFETNDVDQGWNGTYKGKPCQIDVYVYKLEYKDMVEYEHHEKVGRVTLVK